MIGPHGISTLIYNQMLKANKLTFSFLYHYIYLIFRYLSNLLKSLNTFSFRINYLNRIRPNIFFTKLFIQSTGSNLRHQIEQCCLFVIDQGQNHNFPELCQDKSRLHCLTGGNRPLLVITCGCKVFFVLLRLGTCHSLLMIQFFKSKF